MNLIDKIQETKSMKQRALNFTTVLTLTVSNNISLSSAHHSSMPASRPKHYGAAGIGSTSRFDVEIDEALDDSDDMQMCISTRGWSFRFSLSSRAHASHMLAFLREHTGSNVLSELVVGSYLGAPVLLVKDSEYANRVWLRAFRDGEMVEFVLVADDIIEFTGAVAQAAKDLES